MPPATHRTAPGRLGPKLLFLAFAALPVQAALQDDYVSAIEDLRGTRGQDMPPERLRELIGVFESSKDNIDVLPGLTMDKYGSTFTGVRFCPEQFLVLLYYRLYASDQTTESPAGRAAVEGVGTTTPTGCADYFESVLRTPFSQLRSEIEAARAKIPGADEGRPPREVQDACAAAIRFLPESDDLALRCRNLPATAQGLETLRSDLISLPHRLNYERRDAWLGIGLEAPAARAEDLVNMASWAAFLLAREKPERDKVWEDRLNGVRDRVEGMPAAEATAAREILQHDGAQWRIAPADLEAARRWLEASDGAGKLIALKSWTDSPTPSAAWDAFFEKAQQISQVDSRLEQTSQQMREAIARVGVSLGRMLAAMRTQAELCDQGSAYLNAGAQSTRAIPARRELDDACGRINAARTSLWNASDVPERFDALEPFLSEATGKLPWNDKPPAIARGLIQLGDQEASKSGLPGDVVQSWTAARNALDALSNSNNPNPATAQSTLVQGEEALRRLKEGLGFPLRDTIDAAQALLEADALRGESCLLDLQKKLSIGKTAYDSRQWESAESVSAIEGLRTAIGEVTGNCGRRVYDALRTARERELGARCDLVRDWLTEGLADLPEIVAIRRRFASFATGVQEAEGRLSDPHPCAGDLPGSLESCARTWLAALNRVHDSADAETRSRVARYCVSAALLQVARRLDDGSQKRVDEALHLLEEARQRCQGTEQSLAAVLTYFDEYVKWQIAGKPPLGRATVVPAALQGYDPEFEKAR